MYNKYKYTHNILLHYFKPKVRKHYYLKNLIGERHLYLFLD